tara:strand:- start:24318 stop:24521 length:204 start_codon:yes stop_codon:yes gene_type:complete
MSETFLSEYMDGEKTARTFVENGCYGAVFFIDGKEVAKETYPGKAEIWAENAAENYVMGIKVLNESN